ncbi:MAG TPA: CPBP family intramembrane glutamic endopeptidase [Gemmatimonadaceae bacterium]|jgi:membrane protease YdiL (CAAX protease family)
MHPVGLSSAIYLFFLIALVPVMSFKSARAFSAPPDVSGRRAIPPRTTMYLNSLVMLALMFALAWFTARTFAYDLLAFPHFGAREAMAGAVALGFQFAMQYVSHVIRTPEERRTMPVLRMMPQTSRERAIYSVVSLAAGIAEEAAYRGVLTAILWYSLGSMSIAAGISALAFAAGHAMQGWKSAAIVFVMACSMQALAAYTGTLVIAMAVHATYDLFAPTLRRRILRELPTGPERIAG